MNILEEPVPETRSPQWGEEFARTLQEQKERAKEFFASRREKFSSLQTELSLRMADLAGELAREQSAALDRGIAIDSEQSAVGARLAEVQRQRDELTAQYAQWEKAQAESRGGQQKLLAQLQQQFADLNRRQQEIEDAQRLVQVKQAECTRREAELNESLAAIESRQNELQEQSRQLAQTQTGIIEGRTRLEIERQELKNLEDATNRQRRSISRQLRARKKELTAELELVRSESNSSTGQDLELQLRCSELQGTCDRLREEGVELSQQREELQERLSTVQQQLAQKQGEWSQAQKQADETQARLKQLEGQQRDISREREQWKTEKERLTAELEQARSEQGAAQGKLSTDQAAVNTELQRLRDENHNLEEWLKEAEAAKTAAEEAAANAGSTGESSQELADLRRRLDLATNDCREFKGKISELQDQLAKAPQSSQKSGAPAGAQGMDWEAQKRRLLAQLEEDYDEADPVQKANRLTIEEAMQVTETALAAKDQEVGEIRRELEELKSLLQDQSSSIGQFAVGASAFAGMLDKDELVRQERESLQKMQESLREQLKKAEIDISMERAKIARERAELDEKLHTLQREQAQQVASQPGSGGEKGNKAPRGRWLSRLGLSDDK
ncbi:MAG: hypothetical protein K8R36_12490 [Planctomycetales bacterium]|nr:hypothetical protein [Planctomycetales bacterium]